MKSAVVCSVLLVACGGSGSGGTGGSRGSGGGMGSGSASDPFVGSYDCTDDYTLDYTTPAGQPPTMGTTKITATFADNGHGTGGASTLTIGTSTCKLQYAVSGDTATLMSGQSCKANGLSLSYTSGTSTLSGKMTNEAYAYNWTGMGGSGTGTATVTCTKK